MNLKYQLLKLLKTEPISLPKITVFLYGLAADREQQRIFDKNAIALLSVLRREGWGIYKGSAGYILLEEHIQLLKGAGKYLDGTKGLGPDRLKHLLNATARH